jgi:hypothetical protein
MDINDVLGDAPAKQDDRFVVETEKHALWATGKMRKAEERLQQLRVMRDEFHRRIDEWYEAEAKEPQATVDHMAELLRPYVAGEIAKGKKKSMRLPDGTKAGYRSTPERIDNSRDPEATLSWCRAHAPECVKTVETVQKSCLKQRMKQGQPLPPTINIVPGEQRFYVDVREADDATT